MNNSIQKALKIYKYLSIVFVIAYWIYVVIDDYYFIETYWETSWFIYLKIWLIYFIVSFFIFTIYFWIATSVIIFGYHKLFKRIKSR